MESNKFKIFESIMTYCVDVTYTDLENDNYINEFGLTQTIFYDELYLQRKDKEEKIKQALTESTKPLLVFGFPGTGKTTIVTKVLKDLRDKNSDVLVLNFDFKGEDQITSPIVFEKWFKNKLRSKINVFLEQKGISLFDIVLFLFGKENSSYELPVEIGVIKQKLFDYYKITFNDPGELDFHEWLLLNVSNSYVYQRIDEITDNLRNRDILYFLRKSQNQRLFLFCDNMDSIVKNEIRKAFYVHIRSYSGAISKFTNIIVTARYSTISNQSYTDYGAYYWEKISLDYREFIVQDNLKRNTDIIIKQKGYCSPIEYEQLKDKLERDVKEKFSKKFIEKRKHYFNKVIQNKDNLIIAEENEQIEELLDLIISNDHIHVALLELANHDRRWKLRYLVDFIKYIHFDLNIRIENIGLNKDERSFILESYFYHWVITNRRIELDGYNSVDEILNSQEEIKCSLSHLLVTLIYNYTKKERGDHNHSYSITVGKVIEELQNIGYKKEIILKKIFDLYKQEDSFIGLIELSRFFDIKDFFDINENDSIWLTPRATYLCEYLNCKFVFMLAIYRFNKLHVENGTLFNYDDANPITSDTIYQNLFFINKIANNHLSSLRSIKGIMQTNDWIEYYKDWYCLRQKYESEDFDKRFQTEYILISHIKFLERLKSYERYDFISRHIINEYKRLLCSFKTNIDNIKENKDLELFEIDRNLFKTNK